MKKITIFMVALLMVSATSVQAELIGEWHFDEGTGITAFDSSGSGIDGDIFGATWIEDGICGSALHFDGAGPPFDYVSFDPSVSTSAHLSHRLTDAINSKLRRDYTISAWIRPDTVAFFQQGRDVMSFEAIKFGQFSERVRFVPAYAGSFNKGYSILSGDVLVVGQWSHLVGVHREDVGIELYLDGVLIGSDNTKTAADGTALISHGTQVGTTYHHNLAVFAGLRPFRGDIDEVRMYNEALTGDQVEALFAECAQQPCELFTATAFEPPMGKKKKIASTLPIKLRLYFDGVEIVSEEQLNQIQEDNGFTPGCPKLVILLQDGIMGLPVDDVDENVGDPDEGDCFRYSAPNWIYNVRLLPAAFMPHSCYTVEIEIGDCVLVPDNNFFETK